MVTGFSPAVRRTVTDRAQYYCERCGGFASSLYADLHHRRPRGMGGTKRAETNQPSAALYLCRGCHLDIESNRAEALAKGWLVRQTDNPAAVPVLYRGTFVLLDDNGNLHDVEAA